MKMETKDIIVIISITFIVLGVMGMVWVSSSSPNPVKTEVKELNYDREREMVLSLLKQQHEKTIRFYYDRKDGYQNITLYVDSIPYEQWSVMIQENKTDDFSNFLNLVRIVFGIVSGDQYHAVKWHIENPKRAEENQMLDKKIKELQLKGY